MAESKQAGGARGHRARLQLCCSDRVTPTSWQQLQADGHFKHSYFLQNGQQQQQLCLKGSQTVHQESMSSSPSHLSMGWHSFLPSICLPSKNDTALMSEWLRTSPGYSMPWIQLPKLQCQAKHLQLISFAWNGIRREQQSRGCPHSTLSTTSTSSGENPFFLRTGLFDDNPHLSSCALTFPLEEIKLPMKGRREEKVQSLSGNPKQHQPCEGRGHCQDKQPGHWGFKIIHTE